jgi:hypothetical protein
MALTLDWNAIRPLNGDRSKGFEELCAQLARAERPEGASFERKGTPDAGVECFAILPNGEEWGWQSKYFDVLGKSQWSQLDDSVQTALEKHPKLVRYFVCLPLDMPDGRVNGKRSARDLWNTHVATWTGWASAKRLNVYWGSHQLLDQLAQPRHAGRVRFWFDAAVLDQDWFLDRLNEALKTAGPRYTPDIHIDLPIAREFDALGRTERLTTDLKTHARHIRDASRRLGSSSKENEPGLDTPAEALLDKTRGICAQLGELRIDPNGVLPLAAIAAAIGKAEPDRGFQL